MSRKRSFLRDRDGAASAIGRSADIGVCRRECVCVGAKVDFSAEVAAIVEGFEKRIAG